MKNLLAASFIILLVLIGVVWVFAFSVVHTIKPLTTSFYIWNQHWSEAVVEAQKKWHKQVDSFHILVASFKPDKAESHKLSVKRIEVDPKVMNSGRQNTFVFRINGHQLPAVDDVLLEVGYLVDQGLMGPASRLEIDFDSPTSQLANYAVWLSELKTRIDFPLGVTAIPTWLSSDQLKPMLDSLDYYVLQVHSVLSPEQGLFSHDLAQKWIGRFDRLSSTAFMVSLPNYWYQAHYDQDKALMFLKAEQSVYVESSEQRDVFADPGQIAQTIRDVESQSFKHLTGWIWFRMPTGEDQQVFSEPTLQQLIHGRYEAQPAEIEKKVISQTAANYDFWLVNRSGVDVVVDNDWLMVSGCRFRHVVHRVEAEQDRVRFLQPFIMKPGQTIRIGWGQCEEI